jgi:predicted P-loop ATPase
MDGSLNPEQRIAAAGAREIPVPISGDVGSLGLHRLLTQIAKTREGATLPTLANAQLIVRHDPALKGMFGFNGFIAQPLLMRAPPRVEDDAPDLPGPYPRPWGVEDLAALQGYFQRVWSPRFQRQAVEDAALGEANHHRFHPICDYLGGLRWDRVPRLDGWLHQAFGTPLDAYHQAIGAKFLIAAVRRVKQPGSKFDEVPVLKGGQGIGKSTALRKLFGDQFFTDALPADIGGKDAAMSLSGVWAIELAEIEQMARAEVETLKAFLSRQTDRFRPPYGRSFVERPRQCVLVGTTNSSGYLRDATGNRRILPIECQFANVAWVEANRDQLWAEAAAREAAGEATWLDTAEAREAAAIHQAAQLAEDPWDETIRDFLLGKGEATTPILLSDALLIPKERQDRRAQMRAAAILTASGWRQSVEWRSGRTVRLWKRRS